MAPAELRVCRAIFSYPTSEFPGVGLPAYYLSHTLPYRTLHLARRTPGQEREIAPHVELRLLSCPNPPVSGERSLWNRGWRTAAKVLGIASFAARSVPHLLRFRPHILHLHTHLPAPLALLGRALGARVVITVHGTDLLAVQRSRMLRMWYATAADEVWYVSAAMHDELQRLFPNSRLVHTPSGVDLELFHAREAERTPQLVAVGRLKWQKGYPVLLQAFARIKDEFPAHRLVIVGEGELRGELEATVRELGLERRVELVGGRSQEQIATLLSESELFVLASVSEGFPKVLLEAMASGTPSVVTDVGSCGLVVREREVGVVVPPSDPEALADGLRRMLADPALRAACGARARDAAQHYGWGSVARIVDENYRRLAGAA